MDNATPGDSDVSKGSPSRPPLIVGIGASAGGLGAFKTFFSSMPADSGMGFVLVQHLDPDHKSILTELVALQTRMPVRQVADGMRVEADTVYVIPPDATMTIEDGVLRLERPAPPRLHRFPIDSFFISLAEDQGENAVCIVLSGTGSDGTAGLRVVKEHGGLTLAQSEYDHLAMSGMPESAAATGLVDGVMLANDMPARLLAHRQRLEAAGAAPAGPGRRDQQSRDLGEILGLLRSGLGHDFSGYKQNTLLRRIHRRMQSLGITQMPDYIERVRMTPAERDLLFAEMLISVTRFFRDGAAFDALETQILPDLLADKGDADQVRIWVAGCATGEEVYSLAILVRQELERRGIAPKVQIFGTDIDENALGIARAGRYPKAMPGLSAARRERWFVEEGETCHVVKPIREMCVFSLHSLVKDPPFSRLDLVSCRNLLIYLDAGVQERAMRSFHYALRPGGVLLLGPSEGITGSAQLFNTIDAKLRLFRRSDQATPASLPDLPLGTGAPPLPPRPANRPAPQAADPLEQQARALLAAHAPAYLVVNRQHEILRFSGGETGPYLEPSGGVASLGLFSILHKSLRPPVRAALEKALATGATVEHASARFAIAGRRHAIKLVVSPMAAAGGEAGQFLVAFQDLGPVATRGTGKPAGERETLPAALEEELARTHEQLLAAIAEAEAAHAETSASAEEYQSVNEELQSSNEELETAKEEMQSINEELQTLNAELSSKNDLLTRLNSDMKNLIESTRIATLFLDAGMRITGFTPAITGVFHLRDSDRGRPISDITSLLNYDRLAEDVRTVLRQLTVLEREVEVTAGGNCFLMHIRPYLTVDRVVDGVVITFVDITERRRTEATLREHAALVEFAADGLIGIGLDGKVRTWNPGAERLLGHPAVAAIGQPLDFLYAAGHNDRKAASIARALAGRVATPIETVLCGRDGLPLDVELSAVPIRAPDGSVSGAAVTVHNIAERKQAEAQRSLLLRELSHRVKNALATAQALAMETLRTAPSLEAFRDSFVERLLGLARTHDLLTRGEWQDALLSAVLEAELAPYQGAERPRWTAHGPAVLLSPNAALALGMAFHELAINAAKYGALSVPGGQVDVRWRTRKVAEGRRLLLSWIESGGPPVTPPRRQGFGTRLIGDGLGFELDGEAKLEFPPQGVRCTIDIPLPMEPGSP